MATWLKSFDTEQFDLLCKADRQNPYQCYNNFKSKKAGLQEGDIVYLHSKGKHAQVLFKMHVIEKTQYFALLEKLNYVKKPSLLRSTLLKKGLIRTTTLVGGLSTSTKFQVTKDEYKKLFEYIESEFNSSDYPDEADTQDTKYPEGGKKTVSVNKYERSSEARAKCIEIYGTRCKVCEMSFAETYGYFAKDFIHVHHLKPIHEIDAEYEVNPETDLIPVCPNCHAMLHKTENGLPMTVERLKLLFYYSLKMSEHND